MYLIVMVQDNSPFERGDVTSWRPEDSQSFGLEVLRNPLFRVVRVPDMIEAEAEAMCSQQQGDRRLNPNLKLRAFKIDFDLFPAEPKETLAASRLAFSTKWDATAGVYKVPQDVEITASQFAVAKILKPIIDSIIGEPLVIG